MIQNSEKTLTASYRCSTKRLNYINLMKMNNLKTTEETWICILLISAIFSTEFATMATLNLIFPHILSTPFMAVLFNTSVLALVLLPAVLLLKRKMIRTKNRLEKLNSILRAIRKVNELITRESDIQTMFTTACNFLYQVRGYTKVLIVSCDANGKIRKIAEVGEKEFFEVDRITHCIQEAYRKKSVIIFDGKQDCVKCDCNSGLERSTAILPIHGEMFLIVCAETNRFDEEEVELLKEVAEDIGFAIKKYEVENDRNRVIKQLATNLTQFDNTADVLRNPLTVIMSSLELVDELGCKKVLEIIGEHVKRMEMKLNDLRNEEIKTYRLVEELSDRDKNVKFVIFDSDEEFTDEIENSKWL